MSFLDTNSIHSTRIAVLLRMAHDTDGENWFYFTDDL